MTETESKTGSEAESGASENHALDIGYYIASIVIIFGALLFFYGILGPAAQDNRSLGINLNLWWGLFMTLFGLVCFGVSYSATRRRAAGGDG